MFAKTLNLPSALLALAILPLLPPAAQCCFAHVISNFELVRMADAIVEARALKYATPPADPNVITTGVPDSTVRFEVVEMIRGSRISDLVLPGYLVQWNDFNDQQPPFTFVRPSGRRGSCFANSYREHALYLLFLKKTPTGKLTVNWAALAPVNEQLHSSEDQWLVWVRQQAHR